MPRLFPIRAQRLIEARVWFADGPRDVSIFPFFDAEGLVRRILIVDPAENDLREAPSADVIRVPLLARVQVRCGWIDLPPVESFAPYSGTWHFDPAYVARPMRHPLRLSMLETNCPDQFPWKVKDVYFAGDFSTLKWVHKTSRGGETIVKFKPEMLPAPPEFQDEPAAAPPDCGWRLSPIWERRRFQRSL